MPDVPNFMDFVNADKPTPFGATTPKPVITTLFFTFDVFFDTDFTNFQRF